VIPVILNNGSNTHHFQQNDIFHQIYIIPHDEIICFFIYKFHIINICLLIKYLPTTSIDLIKITQSIIKSIL
jgi:hypothetical protein